MKYPTIARDFVAAASTCQEPVKLNMALKLPSGIRPDISDFLLKYSAIWNFKYQRHLLDTEVKNIIGQKIGRMVSCYQGNKPKHQCQTSMQNMDMILNTKTANIVLYEYKRLSLNLMTSNLVRIPCLKSLQIKHEIMYRTSF